MLKERGFDMAFALEAVVAAAFIGWVAREVSKQRSYRETCRARLRIAAA